MPDPKSIFTKSGLLRAFLKCRPGLSRLIARIVKPQDIDDILQETYIRVYAASENTEIRNPKSFMFKTAQNLAFNYVSTAHHQRTQSENCAPMDERPSTPSLESQFESRERFLGFCRAVRELPPQCRRVFLLKKVYGLSQQEISSYLGISESTVEKHVAKGLLLCRESLLDMGHVESGVRGNKVVDGGKRKEVG